MDVERIVELEKDHLINIMITDSCKDHQWMIKLGSENLMREEKDIYIVSNYLLKILIY